MKLEGIDESPKSVFFDFFSVLLNDNLKLPDESDTIYILKRTDKKKRIVIYIKGEGIV